MSKRLFLFLLIGLFSALALSAGEELAKRHAISYDLGGDRFGDKIVGYCHARFLSYSTSVPFLYRHFPNSEKLTIEYEAYPYEADASKFKNNVVHINSEKTLTHFFRVIRDPHAAPTLFIVDYFPTEISEWDRNKSNALLFNVPWQDKQFSEYLRNSLLPKVPIPDFRREGRLNVAAHVRTLSGNDTADTSIQLFPLKHPSSSYHKHQIKKIYEWNLRKPMHVFLFSDTKTPQKLVEEFRASFSRDDITFDIQILERPDLNNVVEDFFAMQMFDVLIATQSNFSLLPSRIGTMDMALIPAHFEGKYPNTWIDRVQMISRKSDWFPYELNIIYKETLN